MPKRNRPKTQKENLWVPVWQSKDSWLCEYWTVCAVFLTEKILIKLFVTPSICGWCLACKTAQVPHSAKWETPPESILKYHCTGKPKIIDKDTENRNLLANFLCGKECFFKYCLYHYIRDGQYCPVWLCSQKNRERWRGTFDFLVFRSPRLQLYVVHSISF